MQDNPYIAFNRAYSNPDPSDGLMLSEGRIEGVSPLSVSAFNVLWSGPGVRASAQLLSGWKQTVSIAQDASTIAGEETITTGGLKVGDSVLCLTDGGSVLYVLCKVVSA